MRYPLRSAYKDTKTAGATTQSARVSVAPQSDSVLFIQGPIGPFFSRIAKDFTERGFDVHKINLNGGDKFFYRLENAVDYTGSREDWACFLRAYVEKQNISRVYVFGDCRYYHDEAKRIASLLSIDFYVFEEGYVRPNYITLEKAGVNGYSQLMKRPAIIGAASSSAENIATAGRWCFVLAAIYSMIYYLAASVYKDKFPYYVHHRPLGWLREGAIWLRSGYRKVLNLNAGQRVVIEIEQRWSSQYFLCPLQVHCDKQVVVHSPFESIDEFIREIITSFAKSAAKNCALVFKHHPLDRGYTEYSQLIDAITTELGVKDRVYYVHDVSLPKMLQQAKGTVMINSTVGLSSLFHNTPVKVLGDAIYDRKGLAFQGSLHDFWCDPGVVDAEEVDRFRSFLMRNNQINGNLYSRSISQNAAGVIWPGKLLSEHSTERELTSVPDEDKQISIVSVANAVVASSDGPQVMNEGFPKSA